MTWHITFVFLLRFLLGTSLFYNNKIFLFDLIVWVKISTKAIISTHDLWRLQTRIIYNNFFFLFTKFQFCAINFGSRRLFFFICIWGTIYTYLNSCQNFWGRVDSNHDLLAFYYSCFTFMLSPWGQIFFNPDFELHLTNIRSRRPST